MLIFLKILLVFLHKKTPFRFKEESRITFQAYDRYMSMDFVMLRIQSSLLLVKIVSKSGAVGVYLSDHLITFL